MQNFVQTKDQLYLRKRKSETYRSMLDEQIFLKQLQNRQQNNTDNSHRKRQNQKEYRATKYNSQIKRIGGRLETLQSRFIPISQNIVDNSISNNLYEDTESQTENYLLECERLINNLKRFNQRQQYKFQRKKHNGQIVSPQKNIYKSFNSPLRRYETSQKVCTNQQNGFFNSQDTFFKMYKSKSYDIKPVYRGLKDKPQQDSFNLKQSGKFFKNKKLHPFQINNNEKPYKLKNKKMSNKQQSDIKMSYKKQSEAEMSYKKQSEENKFDKVEKLNKQFNVFEKRQGVLKHLKIAKKKGSILFKKIQDFKKNRFMSLEKPYVKKVEDKCFEINRQQQRDQYSINKLEVKLNQNKQASNQFEKNISIEDNDNFFQNQNQIQNIKAIQKTNLLLQAHEASQKINQLSQTNNVVQRNINNQKINESQQAQDIIQKQNKFPQKDQTLIKTNNFVQTNANEVIQNTDMTQQKHNVIQIANDLPQTNEFILKKNNFPQLNENPQIINKLSQDTNLQKINHVTQKQQSIFLKNEQHLQNQFLNNEKIQPLYQQEKNINNLTQGNQINKQIVQENQSPQFKI